MSNTTEQEKELNRLIDTEGMDGFLVYKPAILSLCEAFQSREIPYYVAKSEVLSIVEVLYRLLLKQSLTSLNCDDSEWVDRTAESGRLMFQNVRDSRVFKEPEGIFFIEAIRWVDVDSKQEFYGHVDGFPSKAMPKAFPFDPLTIIVRVVNIGDPIGEEKYRILHKSDLDPFFDRYNGPFLGGNPEEWGDLQEDRMPPGTLFQHIHNPSLFKIEREAINFMALRWVPIVGDPFYGTVQGISSVGTFKDIPFVPRTYDVQVRSESDGEGRFHYKVCDPAELAKALETYKTFTKGELNLGTPEIPPKLDTQQD